MRYRTPLSKVPLLLVGLITAACHQAPDSVPLVQTGDPALVTRLVELQPGEPLPAASSPPGYEEGAEAIQEGERLYGWFNCGGCHFAGGGGIGPPLMDDRWIYGKEPANIRSTIVEGRPQGMPSFGGKIPESELLHLVAYVRSLSDLDQKPARR